VTGGDHPCPRRSPCCGCFNPRPRAGGDWNDFIFEAYVNHQTDAIYLAGLPDIPESRRGIIMTTM
jgi:hypothetical protein